MFGTISLLASLLCGDPDEIPSSAAPSALTPNVVSPASNHADQTQGTAEFKRVHYLMKWWESLSNTQPERSAAARQNLRMNITAELNGHAALAVEQLTGRVRETELTEQFTWNLIKDEDDFVCLEARPKDATEQLFYDAIRIWLDSKTCQLSKIQTSDRKGRMFTTWLSVERAAETTLVKFAAAQTDEPPSDEVPPAPSNLNPQNRDRTIQIAATSSSAPLRVRGFNRNFDDAPDPMDLSDVTPRLAEILAQWERNFDMVQTATIRFRLEERNKSTGVTREAVGQLFYRVPNQFKLAIKGSRGLPPNPESAGNNRPTPVGTPLTETWIFTDETLVALNDTEKTYEVMQLRGQSADLGMDSSRRMLELLKSPFLLDINVEQLRRRWSLKLIEDRESAPVIWATPRTTGLKSLYRKCGIKLDPRTWQVTAVQCIDSTNGMESTFTVFDFNRNSALPTDCFTPDLKKWGYKQVGQPNAK